MRKFREIKEEYLYLSILFILILLLGFATYYANKEIIDLSNKKTTI
jgi:hypothetical protein